MAMVFGLEIYGSRHCNTIYKWVETFSKNLKKNKKLKTMY
ncbi:hypothetical protein SAMN05661044_02448 [Olivibacter domesticus]|uniref:Uncharacterized protein n=1 Tax=Olivibacter domesticus TaxID=407022 RepID=A0A1H7Q3X2_OLID1|nr:hypothetical protein SAMN05661044_02448 [Olivibacter domesticus]